MVCLIFALTCRPEAHRYARGDPGNRSQGFPVKFCPMAKIAQSQPYRLSSYETEFLSRLGFKVDSGTIPHTHPISALLRNGFEDMVFADEKGKTVKDIGGNWARHARKNNRQGSEPRNVHCCCPFTCSADVIREVSRDYAADPNVTMCRNTLTNALGIRNCQVDADVYMFNHSMYYIGQQELTVIPQGTTIYSMHHVFPGAGKFCCGEVECMMKDNGDVRVVAKGNDVPYEHPNCWLNGECVIPGNDGAVIAFKIVARYETCYIFKGKVMKLSVPLVHSLYSDPVYKPIMPYVSELEKALLAEVIGTTIDAKTVHVLHMRARTICVTKGWEIPSNLPDIIIDTLNNSAEQTVRMQKTLHLERITENNYVVGDILEVLAPDTVPWYRRIGNMFTETVANGVKSIGYRVSVALDKAVKSGVNFRKYAVSRVLTHVRTMISAHPVVQAPINVPERCWENELVAIVNRAIPPSLKCVVSPKITDAAQKLAKLIGAITTPVDFEEWLTRYPERRRDQLRNARNRYPGAYSAAVQMFMKVEKLDKQSDPRAIQARHDSFKALAGPWIAQLEKRCTECLPFLVKGLDPIQRAEKIERLRKRADNVLEIDFERFDRHCSRPLLEASEHLIYSIVLPIPVQKLMLETLNNAVFSSFGAEYNVEATRMSGDVSTSIGNCLIVACLMIASGLPLDSFVVEGDDMLAAVTDHERCEFNSSVIAATGMKPKLVLTHRAGTFCSRHCVVNSNGDPVRVRHPLRDLTRYGYAIHDAKPLELARLHATEWNGVPMLGPVYLRRLEELDPTESDNEMWIRQISPQARAAFQVTFGISHDLQTSFENDPSSRERIYRWLQDAQECPCPVGTSTPAPEASEEKRSARGDATSQISGASRSRRGRKNQELRLHSGSDRNGPSRLASGTLRNVQDNGSQVRLQSRSGNNNKWRGVDGNRLRPEGCRPDIPRNSSASAQGDGPRVERSHGGGTSGTGNETEMANDIQSAG